MGERSLTISCNECDAIIEIEDIEDDEFNIECQNCEAWLAIDSGELGPEVITLEAGDRSAKTIFH